MDGNGVKNGGSSGDQNCLNVRRSNDRQKITEGG